MAESLSPADARTLLDLCDAGRLYDVERWVASGKSLNVPSEFRRRPLHIAIETGFHSLVELLARRSDQHQKNSALACAVSCRRADIVELVLSSGAEIRAVPFSTVLFTWEPQVIRMFLARGADAITDAPFAHAFCRKIRTAIGPYLEYKRAHPELARELQGQADIALRHHCETENLKWISLMMWAGADPRARGPSFNDDYAEAPEDWRTAFECAAHAEDANLPKALKLDPARDDLGPLLKNASVFSHAEIVNYLLTLGAHPNDRPDGTSSAIPACLERMGWQFRERYRSLKSRWSVTSSVECLKSLVAHGACWAPSDRAEMIRVRRGLLECEPGVTVDVIQVLATDGACTIEVLRELVRTPSMKEHLKPVAWHIRRLKLSLWEEPKKPSGPRSLSILIRQYDREKLYEQVWERPIRSVAKEYGVSDVWLAKVCRWLKVPLPGRGYWAKKAGGHPVPKRPKLPTAPKISRETR